MVNQKLLISVWVCPLDEVPGTDVAKKLVESIRAKLSLEELKEVLESVSVTQPDLTDERKILT